MDVLTFWGFWPSFEAIALFVSAKMWQQPTVMLWISKFQKNSIFYSDKFDSNQRTMKATTTLRTAVEKELLCSVCLDLSQATSKRVSGKAQSSLGTMSRTYSKFPLRTQEPEVQLPYKSHRCVSEVMLRDNHGPLSPNSALGFNANDRRWQILVCYRIMMGILGSDLKYAEYITIRNKWIIYLGMIWKTVN